MKFYRPVLKSSVYFTTFLLETLNAYRLFTKYSIVSLKTVGKMPGNKAVKKKTRKDASEKATAKSNTCKLCIDKCKISKKGLRLIYKVLKA